MKNYLSNGVATIALLLFTALTIAPLSTMAPANAASTSEPSNTILHTPIPDNPVAVSIDGLGQVDG